jgi:hypothetical protein
MFARPLHSLTNNEIVEVAVHEFESVPVTDNVSVVGVDDIALTVDPGNDVDHK